MFTFAETKNKYGRQRATALRVPIELRHDHAANRYRVAEGLSCFFRRPGSNFSDIDNNTLLLSSPYSQEIQN